ncbi:SDR family oxidoreductase [Halobaculum sp. MBLA0147]|uniref:SDR family oxidoreductase n=1 Tax=Halobaculum sp. MBLA0147 TaxID=3079934 RepID=UPI0035265860
MTGFPGFLGSALLPRLLARGDGPITCLVQPAYRETAARRAEAVVGEAREIARESSADDTDGDTDEGSRGGDTVTGAARRPTETTPGPTAFDPAAEPGRHLRLVEGDITEPDLDLDPTAADRLGAVNSVYHLAAVYDLGVSREVGEAVNVDGTRHVLGFAREAGVDRFHYVSTCYVSGRYEGVFAESHLREGQSFNNHYEATKYRAEVLVREAIASGFPATVYRPSIVVGDSRTGETEKYDGPYYLLRLLAAQPAWLSVSPSLPGAARTEMNVVPRDFVVDAIAALSAQPDTVAGTYHLCDPAPLTVPAFLRTLGDALGHRTLAVPAPKRLVRRGMRALADRGVVTEPATVDYFDHPTRHANPATQRALADTGVSCPRFPEYADALVAYFREHPDVRVDAMQ